MSKVVRVKYEKGVLKPLESVSLEEGREAQIVIQTLQGMQVLI